ncbi:MAG: hydrogenase maturation protease [Dehalococcoidia bacterium]
MKTLVLGLGNPILSDDAVGIRVAREVERKLNDPRVTVSETSEAGLSLLDAIVGYDEVIIIDAVQTEKGQAGQIHHMRTEDLSFSKRFTPPHQINLATSLELGNALNLAMPRKITIFAVEAEDVTTFSEKCTPQVEKAIPEVVKMVLEELVG